MPIAGDIDFLVQWHITEQCNLHCSHCYQSGSAGSELTLPEIRDTLSEIFSMCRAWQDAYGIAAMPEFNITGGEPLLRRDLTTILEEIAGKGHAVYLLTNGILIDQDKARQFVAAGVRGVQVSLEGPEEVHDRIRGTRSFHASLNGIAALLDAKMPVTVNTTLSRMNADVFFELARQMSALGVPRLGYSRLVPSGRGAGLVGQMLGTDEVQRLYERVNEFPSNGLEFVSGDPVGAQMRATAPVRLDRVVPCGGCAAGVSGITILSDGTLVPCRRMPLPLGNVRSDSLREVWSASPVLEALRDRSRYGGKCGRCERWSDCRGCRAIAYAASQAWGKPDMLAEDPQCFIDIDDPKKANGTQKDRMKADESRIKVHQ